MPKSKSFKVSPVSLQPPLSLVGNLVKQYQFPELSNTKAWCNDAYNKVTECTAVKLYDFPSTG